MGLRDNKEKTNSAPSVLINELIRFPRVQLIGADGQNVGVVMRNDALRMAHEAGLDLVLIAAQGAEGVPVVKIMDFGKALYAKKKKTAQAKKQQKVIQVKEIKIRPKIGEHDYKTKINQAVDFLKEGKRVKVTLVFKGREMASQYERGHEMFAKVDGSFRDAGIEVLHEKDSKLGTLLSRIYFLKTS